MTENPVQGQTIRWWFDDGPTAGKAFEHSFGRDGSVTYAMEGSGKRTREPHYEAVQVGKHVIAVSYLSSSGWTLTVVMDDHTGEATAFASNDKQLVVQHGHFERLRRAA